MKRYGLKLFILLNIFFISFSALAQNKKNTNSFSRFFFGGDFWISFGTTAYINLSPLAGYRITPRLSAGLGPIYIFQKEKLTYLDTVNNYFRSYSLKYSIYGGRVFLTYDLIQNIHKYIPVNIGNILVHCENEVINIDPIYWNPNIAKFYLSGDRLWIDNLLLGAGIRQPIGERSSINLLILWDITGNKYSPHTNPIIRIGFNF